MPNLCSYLMKIVGSKNSCEEWVKRMDTYDEPNHFWRISNADVVDDGYYDNGDYFMVIEGDCAWSLESCCRSRGYSGGKDLFSINCKELGITMEAYSEECGMCFQEHYRYNKDGNCLVDECVDWQVWEYAPREWDSFAEFRKAFDLPDGITEDDFDDGRYQEGGYDEWEFEI